MLGFPWSQLYTSSSTPFGEIGSTLTCVIAGICRSFSWCGCRRCDQGFGWCVVTRFPIVFCGCNDATAETECVHAATFRLEIEYLTLPVLVLHRSFSDRAPLLLRMTGDSRACSVAPCCSGMLFWPNSHSHRSVEVQPLIHEHPTNDIVITHHPCDDR
jgi:hypothetical protein